MILKHFLFFKNITRKELAQELQVSEVYAGKIVNGLFPCTDIMAIKIEDYTKRIDPKNYVTAEEMKQEHKRRQIHEAEKLLGIA